MTTWSEAFSAISSNVNQTVEAPPAIMVKLRHQIIELLRISVFVPTIYGIGHQVGNLQQPMVFGRSENRHIQYVVEFPPTGPFGNEVASYCFETNSVIGIGNYKDPFVSRPTFAIQPTEKTVEP